MRIEAHHTETGKVVAVYDVVWPAVGPHLRAYPVRIDLFSAELPDRGRELIGCVSLHISVLRQIGEELLRIADLEEEQRRW